MALRFPPVSQFLDRFRAVLRRRSRFDFDVEVRELSRVEQAVAFLALLDLRRSGEIVIDQAAPFAPIRVARALHYPVMLFFVAFIIVHVVLVFATGILRNLNHMYAVRNDESWLGFGIFAGTVVLMILAWFAAQPVVLRSIASLTGSVTR
jgi:hypothetical protein